MSGYRVWCLSWDDDEEDHGQSYLDKPNSKAQQWAVDSAGAARMYSYFCHAERYGRESSWPLKFRVRLPDGTTEDFEVDREMVPEFHARRLMVAEGEP